MLHLVGTHSWSPVTVAHSSICDQRLLTETSQNDQRGSAHPVFQLPLARSAGLAQRRLQHLGIPLDRKAEKLSGGQQAQVALVMALGKQPKLLLLDEPVAALDPLARREFLQALLEATVEDGLTILLSSHIIGDLERVCDYLIILSASRVVLTGDIEHVVERHKLLVGPNRDAEGIASVHNVVQATHTERQTTLLVRTNGHIWDPSCQVHDVSLEEIVLAYLGKPSSDDSSVMSECGNEEVPA